MDISKYNPNDFSATYSPEDNKLRLYTEIRIDSEDWAAMKSSGWKWAPVQKLFVAYWSLDNEDFCLALAGDILPEGLTMVERAEAKADRLLLLAQKRSDQCHGYQLAANDLMQRIGNNQPILSGHHSERKAKKTEKQIERAIDNAHSTAEAVGYWVWRAKGVIGHADHKNNTRTISNRIKTLSKDLRDQQRAINEAAHTLNVIDIVKNKMKLGSKTTYTYNLCGQYEIRNLDLDNKMRKGEITEDQALENLQEIYTARINSKRRARIINHLLNRLAYEQGQLAIVPLYDGALTPAVLQTFLRAHGADKPEAEFKNEAWTVTSSVCLPLHLSSSCDLELSDQEWRELMQSVGYEVPAKRAPSAKAAIPILNFKTDQPVTWQGGYRARELDQVELTKEQYKQIGTDHKSTILSKCKTFRIRIGFVKMGVDGYGRADYDYKAVFLTDSKVHEMPETAKPGQIALI
jgi:hypothetical protein